MSKDKNGVKRWAKTPAHRQRRKSAIERLEAQLLEGLKLIKGKRFVAIPLTDKDVKRIEKELTILKQRI
jgi:hypothetical protein